MSSTATSTEVAEVLSKARNLIEQGWVKGVYATGKGQYCAVGALRHAAFGRAYDIDVNDPEYQAYAAARARLISVTGVGLSGDFWGITDWNDYVGTTKDAVLEAFDRAARL